jgi:hypothetical protein
VKISELTAALNKVSQVAGDVDLVLRQVDADAPTFLHGLLLDFDPVAGAAGSTVTIEHDTEPPAGTDPADASGTHTTPPA